MTQSPGVWRNVSTTGLPVLLASDQSAQRCLISEKCLAKVALP